MLQSIRCKPGKFGISAYTHSLHHAMEIKIMEKVKLLFTLWVYSDASFVLTAADVSEDPFNSRQDESSEGLSHNLVVESLLQRNRDISFTSRDNPEGAFSRPTRSFITEEILEALRKADRKGRDVVVGLSNACCKWGCSKSEISSLC